MSRTASQAILWADFSSVWLSVVASAIKLGSALRSQRKVIIRIRCLVFKGLRGAPRGCLTSHGGCLTSHAWSRLSCCLALCRCLCHQAWSCSSQPVESANPNRDLAFKGPPGSSEGGASQAAGGCPTSHTLGSFQYCLALCRRSHHQAWSCCAQPM